MLRPRSSRLQQQVARELAAAVRRVEREHKYSDAVGEERRRARRHQGEQHARCLLGDAVSNLCAGARAVAVAIEVEVQVAGAPVLEELVGVPLWGTNGESLVPCRSAKHQSGCFLSRGAFVARPGVAWVCCVVFE